MKSFFKRLWPKSLAEQMIALMLITLFGAQIIGFAIFTDERRLAVRSVMRQQILTRTASVARLLKSTPKALHQNVVDSATTRRLRFQLAGESSLPQAERSPAEELLFIRLSALLGKDGGDLRLKIMEEGGFSFWRSGRRFRSRHHDNDDDDDERHERRHGPRFPPMGLGISLKLAPDSWLNVTTLFRFPGLAWTSASHISLMLTALVLALVLIFMVRRVTRPMAHLATAADRLGRGEEVDPIPEKGPPIYAPRSRPLTAWVNGWTGSSGTAPRWWPPSPMICERPSPRCACGPK
ncbi:MAG: hypothetical protein QGF09_01365 [Rhodospirillales bacterium]|jgi:hypothetical protein|nr:hypothetical protein [Rhodospirillales bacterium]